MNQVEMTRPGTGRVGCDMPDSSLHPCVSGGQSVRQFDFTKNEARFLVPFRDRECLWAIARDLMTNSPFCIPTCFARTMRSLANKLCLSPAIALPKCHEGVRHD